MNKIILLTSFIITGLYVVAQNTSIPDSNFEQALIDLGLDSVLNGSIPTANIDTVSILYIPNKFISDLTGIEDFNDLKNLGCYNNQLTSLDVSQNTALESLLCSNNLITSINVSQNTLLTSLLCSSNSLSILDVVQNSNLVILRCNDNQLSSLDVSQCDVLVALDCGANQLNSLDVTQNINLINLNCGTNELTSLDVSQNLTLELLTFHVNQLTSIDVTQNVVLTNLDCDFNQLLALDVTQNPFLDLLYCFNNQLSYLDVSQNIYLDRLACYDNQLICLNLKNGNNNQMSYFGTFNNANLTCIEVDDDAWSSSYWTVGTGEIDTQMYFSNNCGNNCTTGLDVLSGSVDRQLLKIIDVTGRETGYKPNMVLIYLYSDGSTERVFSGQ